MSYRLVSRTHSRYPTYQVDRPSWYGFGRRFGGPSRSPSRRHSLQASEDRRLRFVGPASTPGKPQLHAGEDDRARAVGFDDLPGRRQRTGGLVDRELHDRVGVFLIGRSEALIGVGRVEKSGGGI